MRTTEAEVVILSFGKYAGYDLADVPRDYIEFILGSNKRQIEQFESELDRRDAEESATQTMAEQIITSGYRLLAQKHHPDFGGSTQTMQQLNGAVEVLRRIVREDERLNRC